VVISERTSECRLVACTCASDSMMSLTLPTVSYGLQPCSTNCGGFALVAVSPVPPPKLPSGIRNSDTEAVLRVLHATLTSVNSVSDEVTGFYGRRSSAM
jgi:hypothetical protein